MPGVPAGGYRLPGAAALVRAVRAATVIPGSQELE